MPDLTTLPLAQLLHHCRPLAQPLTPQDEAAWNELLRRALLQRNDAAWDALVQRLWPFVLHLTYGGFPEMSPSDVEGLAQLVIWTFLQEQLGGDVSPQSLPQTTAPTATTPPSIVAQLQQLVQRLSTK